MPHYVYGDLRAPDTSLLHPLCIAELRSSVISNGVQQPQRAYWAPPRVLLLLVLSGAFAGTAYAQHLPKPHTCPGPTPDIGVQRGTLSLPTEVAVAGPEAAAISDH